MLLTAQKELAQKTDIKFEFKEIKTGKKVSDLEFIIYRNNDYDGQITFGELDIAPTEQHPQEADPALDELLLQFKAKTTAEIKPEVLEILVEAKGSDTVKKYIDNWDKFKYKDIDNVVGFFKQAVLKEYDIPKKSPKPSRADERERINYNDLYDNMA